MLVCIAGKNDIAVEGLLKAISIQDKYGFELGIVCNKTETGKNSWQRSLRWYAKKYNIKEYSLDELYNDEELVFLSLEYDSIIRPNKFKSSKLFNIHYSYLPMYKGMYTSAVPLLNNEKYTGVTLHYIDAGIDTGKIIAQRKFEIKDTDTCRDLYFKYTQNAISLIKEKMELLITKEVIDSVEQPIDNASYYSKKYLDYANITIDLQQVSSNIKNQIRAFTFREYQLPTVFDRKVISARPTKIKSTMKPGTILMENKIGCMVATIDYNALLYWDRFDELLEACRTGNIGVVNEICEVSEHINQANNYGWTPLIVATYNAQYEVVQNLILRGADIFSVNYNGTNLLMYAKEAFVNTGECRIFELLYKLGLKLESVDYQGNDLRHYCNQDGITQIGSICLV